MQPPAVGVKEGHDVQRHDLCVENLGILEDVIPDLLDGFMEEFGNAPLGCLVTGVVIKAGLVGRFCSDADNDRGIIGNAAIVERQAGGTAEGGTTMVGGIPRGICEDGCEGMNPPQLIVGDHHEEGEDRLSD